MYLCDIIKRLTRAIITKDREVIQRFSDHHDPRVREASQAAADAVSEIGMQAYKSPTDQCQ